MTQTTYQVILSTSGKHTVIVSSDNVAEMKQAAGWAKATYEALVERYGLKAAPKSDKTEDTNDDPAPICEVHHVPMLQVQGRKGPFWSCHKKNANGSWCDWRPKK